MLRPVNLTANATKASGSTGVCTNPAKPAAAALKVSSSVGAS